MFDRHRVAFLLGSALLAFSAASATAGGPNGDPLRSKQWGLDQIHAPQTWAKTTGRGAVVAVIDQGVDASHPDLLGRVLPGKDFIHHSANAWTDTSGHGTGVAGVVAAIRNNGKGIVGVAPDSRILPVKVGENDVYTAVPDGIRWAADHGAKVIVIAIGQVPGGGLASRAVTGLTEANQAAIDHAWARGAVVVVAAGNNSEPYCSSPAYLRHAVCVGAVDKRAVTAGYSNHDTAMTTDYLVAPGGSDVPVAESGLDELIWTTAVVGTGTQVQTSQWAEEAGTSFAVPFVGGVAALLSSRGLTNAAIVKRLLSTATDLGAPGRDPLYGFGEVDAARAVG